MSIAYALRAQYDNDEYLGGVLAVGNGDIDVRAALKAGDGVIVVPDSDTLMQAVLDAYAPLKRVAVPKDDPPPAVDQLEDLKVTALRDEAKVLGVETRGLNKDELITAIHAAKGDDA